MKTERKNVTESFDDIYINVIADKKYEFII